MWINVDVFGQIGLWGTACLLLSQLVTFSLEKTIKAVLFVLSIVMDAVEKTVNKS